MSADRVVRLHAFLREVELARAMDVSVDPVLVEGGSDAERREIRTMLYGQICTSWRELVGVRFKLLGFVPAVSVVGLATLLGSDRLSDLAGAGIAALGLVVTFALLLYDQRNSQLHDELISRGRRIEFELGIDVGQFRGRPGSRGIVKHDHATALVYAATMVAWTGAALSFAV